MGAVLQFTAQLETLTCFQCGIEFALPARRVQVLRESKESFFCPAGHSQAFVKSEADKLREQLAAANAETEHQRRHRADAEHARDIHSAARTKAEKKLQRAKNGVCPCCKRSFTALRRHMASKHPEWQP